MDALVEERAGAGVFQPSTDDRLRRLALAAAPRRRDDEAERLRLTLADSPDPG